MMTPFPGTVDFERWEKEQAESPTYVGGIPITRYWLIPIANRPKMFTPHPSMSSDEIRERTQSAWDRFYNMRSIWKRSACTPTPQVARCLLLSVETLSPDVRRHGNLHRQCTPEEVEDLRPVGLRANVANCSRRSPCPSCGRQTGNCISDSQVEVLKQARFTFWSSSRLPTPGPLTTRA